MPRRSRLVLPGVPMHLIQRGNNRQATFFADEDYLNYLHWLTEGAERFACRVHAWVLMTNHVHLLVSADEHEAVARLMKSVGQRYTQYVNRVYGRTGSLWEGRFRSCLTDSDVYVLTCMRYIELNPVRACMVEHPADYRWSSYRTNAQGKSSLLITPHPAYRSLGLDVESRTRAYQRLFDSNLSAQLVSELRDATNGNRVFGSGRFAQQIGAALGCRTVRGAPGRPANRKYGA